MMVGKPPKGTETYDGAPPLLPKFTFYFVCSSPLHFCLGSFCMNTTHLLWEVLEERLKVLIGGEDTPETFRESGWRLDDCAETVLQVDLTANHL